MNRHAPTYMGAFGAAIIAVALFMQVDIAELDFTLTPAEFIVVVLSGLVMICLGAALVGIRVRSFERTEVAHGEQAKEILTRNPLMPGSTLQAKPAGPEVDRGSRYAAVGEAAFAPTSDFIASITR